MKNRKLSKYAIFIIIYTFVAIIGIIVLDVVIHNKLVDYQKSYDDAVRRSKPDLYMDSFIKSFDKSTYEEYLRKDETYELGPYDDIEGAVSKALSDFEKHGELTYKRIDGFDEMKPAYDIYDGDKLIASVSFKRKVLTYRNKVDEYSVGKMVLGNYIDSPYYVKVVINSNEKLYLNGKLVEDEKYIVARKPVSIEGFSGKYEIRTYYVSGLYSEPKVHVEDMSGRTILENPKGDYSLGEFEGVKEYVAERVVEPVYDYARFFNRNISYTDYIKTLIPESNINLIAANVVEGLKWRDEAKKMELLESEVSDIIMIDDKHIKVKVSLTYHMVFEKFEKNESVSYDCIMEEKDGRWYVLHLSI